jgi:hypothetical protein
MTSQALGGGEFALRLVSHQRVAPLYWRSDTHTHTHIKGKCNAISDAPSRSFGSNPAWKCDTDTDLLTLFNPMFPLPHQDSWMVFHLNCKVVTRVISALRMTHFALTDWRRLSRVGRHKCTASPDLHNKHEKASMARDDKSKAALYLKRSWSLARQSRWPTTTILQR